MKQYKVVPATMLDIPTVFDKGMRFFITKPVGVKYSNYRTAYAQAVKNGWPGTRQAIVRRDPNKTGWTLITIIEEYDGDEFVECWHKGD